MVDVIIAENFLTSIGKMDDGRNLNQNQLDNLQSTIRRLTLELEMQSEITNMMLTAIRNERLDYLMMLQERLDNVKKRIDDLMDDVKNQMGGRSWRDTIP